MARLLNGHIYIILTVAWSVGVDSGRISVTGETPCEAKRSGVVHRTPSGKRTPERKATIYLCWILARLRNRHSSTNHTFVKCGRFHFLKGCESKQLCFVPFISLSWLPLYGNPLFFYSLISCWYNKSNRTHHASLQCGPRWVIYYIWRRFELTSSDTHIEEPRTYEQQLEI